jgi:hypothetical protein
MAQWDPDRVTVSIGAVPTGPIAPGKTYADTYGHQPVILQEIRAHLIGEHSFTDIFGLRCWPAPAGGSMCEDPANPGAIFISVDVPLPSPYVVNPMLKAEYLSSRYHGVSVFWYTSAKYFAQWQRIDSRVWEVVSAWNVAEPDARDQAGMRTRN